MHTASQATDDARILSGVKSGDTMYGSIFEIRLSAIFSLS